MTKTDTPRRFSRRSFIKGAAALTATGALAGCTPNTEDKETVELTQTGTPDEIFTGVCRGNCFGSCKLDIHVRDGRIVRTTAGEMPDPRYNRICSKGLTQLMRVYSPERLQYPMRRIGERGAGEFERISWDEAIDEIAEKWQAIIDEHGARAIAIVWTSGQYGICSGHAYGDFYNRFRATLGFSELTPEIDAASGYAGARFSGGGSVMSTNNEPTDFCNSKTIILWGTNPAISHLHIMQFILDAKERGTKVVSIDPIFNPTVAKADWHVPINASTDGALALSILNEIISAGKEDVDFVRNHTEAPLLIKEDGSLLRMSDLGVAPTEGEPNPATGEPTVIDPYVVWDENAQAAVSLEEATMPGYRDVPPSVEGVAVTTVWDNMAASAAKWPAEKAAETCGIAVEDIKELARIYVEDGPVNTSWQFGPDHYVNGHYNYWPMAAVSAVTGNIGKPGAARGAICGSPANVINFPASLAPVDKNGNPAQGSAPAVGTRELLRHLTEGKELPDGQVIKSLYVALSNIATVYADHNWMAEGLKALEFLVVADISMTETAMYADILLPAAHWFEQMDVATNVANHPYLVLQEKAIEPQFESKTDFEIYKLIGTKMGYGDFLDFTEEEYIELALDTDTARELGVTLENLKKDGAVRFVPGDVFITDEGGNFAKSPTGRARFYLEEPAPNYNVGQEIDYSKERSLYWEPAMEADVNSSVREKYPFHLFSEHMRTRTHSQWYDVELLKEFEPEPMVRLNPEDAAELGIVDGDTVRVYNDRGEVTLRATISAGYPRGMVGGPRSYHAKEFIAGHFAALPSFEYNQVCANQAFNDVAVAIEKA